MERMDTGYTVTLGLLAEMVWDNAIRKHREERLLQEIDQALAQGDEASFLELTNELKRLQAFQTFQAMK
jgi:uncharacterized protein YpiB (UPF0302 family)